MERIMYGANGEQERVTETEKALEVRLSINHTCVLPTGEYMRAGLGGQRVGGYICHAIKVFYK